MKKLNFQVVCKSKQGEILGYADFDWTECQKMFEWVEYNMTRREVQIVEIGRWNEKGERE